MTLRLLSLCKFNHRSWRAPISTFSFPTVNSQSYTVQQNTNLAGTNWTYYTNLTGNGSLMQVVTPVTNVPMHFFRVWEP